MNILKVTSKDGQDILWLISSLCDFVVHRGSYFVHTELTQSALKRKIRKEGYDIDVLPVSNKEEVSSLPDIISVWAINDGSKKALNYLHENKDEINEKILNYVIDSLTDILKDVEDMKGGKVVG